MNDLSRRSLLLGGLAVTGAGLFSACSRDTAPRVGRFTLPEHTPLSPAAGQRVTSATLTAKPATLDLGGLTVDTWAFGDLLPGPIVRARAGDLLRVSLKNELPTETSIHWHGIALRNEADGVPDLTQIAVAAGDTFTYEFVAPDPGTYFYHPHVGVQLDRGLYAPLIIDDPNEPGEYDDEWIVVLDDWIDGTGKTPDDIFTDLTGKASSDGMDMGAMDMDGDTSGDMGGMDHGDMNGMDMGSSDSPFGDAGDVTYPHYLINGRLASAPDEFRAKPGKRIRLRVINAAADTIFAFALGGHRLTITHTDGFPVRPRTVDALYLAMGERYDCIVTTGDGVFPLVAKPVGKTGQALSVVRTAAGAIPAPTVRVSELDGRVATVADLEPAESARLPRREVGQSLEMSLTGQMDPYAWGINGKPFGTHQPLELKDGNRVRIALNNTTMMAHPMHIHGHTFALPNGLRKDTVLLKPMQKLDVELQADNPGNWMAHCHNAYHAEAGMMAALVYT